MKRLIVGLLTPIAVGAALFKYRKALTKLTGTWIGEPQTGANGQAKRAD